MDTLLNLTNQTLIRLRESQVASIDETEYSTLVAQFVKQAVSEVEDATDWIQLRTTIQIPVVAGLFSYILTGAGQGFHILDVYEDTEDYALRKAPSYAWMNHRLLDNDQTPGEPFYYDVNGVDVNGDPAVNFYPIPDDTYSVNFNMKIKSQLVVDGDTTPVPSLPIVLRAAMLAVEERGDDQGPSLDMLATSFDVALSSAVMLDTGNYPDETVWFWE